MAMEKKSGKKIRRKNHEYLREERTNFGNLHINVANLHVVAPLIRNEIAFRPGLYF